ncbi:hypothetical protein [Candidatus Endomicrobiellum agilis]|uniref:hypothetical protein n=1 Tax=Candidatus Endomicrobiellum agilis TaxID=3238957 RepID=UPI003585E3A5|nr:hypothetical protein [Endomicrobium sp.]
MNDRLLKSMSTSEIPLPPLIKKQEGINILRKYRQKLILAEGELRNRIETSLYFFKETHSMPVSNSC